MRVLTAADKFQVQMLVDYCTCHFRRLLMQGNVSLDDIIVVRKMLQQCTGSNTPQLARDCEAYVAARAASDPSKMWSILDGGGIAKPYEKPCSKAHMQSA